MPKIQWKIRQRMGLAALLVVGLSDVPRADALTHLFSPTLTADQQMLDCTLTNVGTNPIRLVRLSLVEYQGEGTVARTSCPSLMPNTSCGVRAFGPLAGFCKIATSAKLQEVRARIEVNDLFRI
jgi:hypothetical protein